jgi:hypothetical protein
VGLHETLNTLLSLCYGWMNLTVSASSPSTGFTVDPYAHGAFSYGRNSMSVSRHSMAYFHSLCVRSHPSDSMLAAASLSSTAAFVYRSDRCKKLFAKSGAAKISLLDTGFNPNTHHSMEDRHFLGKYASSALSGSYSSTAAGHGNALTHLTSMGLSGSIVASGRSLCLNLLTSLLLVENSCGSIEKSTIGNQLASHLQKSARDQSSKNCNPEVVGDILFHVIAAWTAAALIVSGSDSVLPASNQQSGGGIDPSKHTAYIPGGSGSGSKAARDVHTDLGAAQVSIPELLFSLYENRQLSAQVPVVAQIVRAAGSMCAGPNLVTGVETFVDSNGVGGNNIGQRRMLANAASDKCLSILADCLVNKQARLHEDGFAGLLMVTLWTLLHNSENAKSSWKRLVDKGAFQTVVETLYLQHRDNLFFEKDCMESEYDEAVESFGAAGNTETLKRALLSLSMQ